MILSTKESGELASWLVDNGYHLPDNAKEVLRPYVKNNLKFFVVKVNLQKHYASTPLRPLQIEYEHDRFMLPIRLGMANSKGEQDMVVYALSKIGRVETVNYRTVPIPTNVEVPVFVENKFEAFYRDVYQKAWEKEGKKAVHLEYAWDLSGSNSVKCDPCPPDVPMAGDLKVAGARWIDASNNYGPVFFTRLHLRYGREHFPEDLTFVETPNKERFQGRYIIRHMAPGPFDCEKGQEYLAQYAQRCKREAENLAELTGWEPSKDNKIFPFVAAWRFPKRPHMPGLFVLALLVLGGAIFLFRTRTALRGKASC